MAFFRRIACVLVAAILLNGSQLRAQTFTNGGFESVSGTPIPSDTGKTLNVGDTWLTGWSSAGTNGSVVVQNGYDGGYFFGYLDGMTPWQGEQWVIFPNDSLGGSLSQTFRTGVGDYCSMTFAGTYVYTADDPMLGMEIQASDGTVLTNSTYAVYYREWTNFQFSFIATTPTTTLTFYDASPDAEGADIGLDGVTLVTEPPGWPYIITSPESQTNGAGALATFTASAGGNPSTVQWYLGCNAVTNATNTTLSVIASDATAGAYTAVFSNAAGTDVSQPATLTVLEITTPPTSLTVDAGSLVTLSADANLGGATNQWYFGPYPIPGATQPTYTIIADNQTAGNYSVQFGIGNATVTSAEAQLIVSNIPFINGSFEETSYTSIAPGNDLEGNVGDVWLTGWAFGGSTNETFVFNSSFLGLNAADGSQWLVFDAQNSPPPGAVSQTFSTVVGENYYVTFSTMAVDYFNAGQIKSLTATVMASDGSLLAGANVEPATNWSMIPLTFTAKTINTTLAFTDTSAPGVGPSVALDAVSVVKLIFSLIPVSPQLRPGSLVLQLVGTPGKTYVMQTSTNLAAWSAVSTNLLSVPVINVTNAPAPGTTRQFWRAAQLP